MSTDQKTETQEIIARLRKAIDWIEQHQAKAKSVDAEGYWKRVDIRLESLDEMRRLFPGQPCKVEHRQDMTFYELFTTVDGVRLKIKAVVHHDRPESRNVTL